MSRKNKKELISNSISTEETVSDSVNESGTVSKRGPIIRYIILLVAVVVFAFSASKLIFIKIRYKVAQNTYDNIASDIFSPEDETETAEIDVNGVKYPGVKINSNINFDKLYAQNNSAIGWVDIPQLGISYPIAQYTDNDYYLTHDFNNNECYSGCIFLDYSNSANLNDSHTFLYGHHMQDGSMFASLLEYDNESFFKEHEKNNDNYFYVYVKDHVNVYKIFSVCDVSFDTNREAFVANTNSFYTLTDYVNYIKSIENYSTGIDILPTDKVVTLYTCQGASESGVRHLVHGKLLTTINYE